MTRKSKLMKWVNTMLKCKVDSYPSQKTPNETVATGHGCALFMSLLIVLDALNPVLSSYMMTVLMADLSYTCFFWQVWAPYCFFIFCGLLDLLRAACFAFFLISTV